MKKSISIMALTFVLSLGAFVSFSRADAIQDFLDSLAGKQLGLQIEGNAAFVKDVYVGEKVGIGTAEPGEALTVEGVVEAKEGVKFGDGSVMESADNPVFNSQVSVGEGETTIDWKLGNHYDFTFGPFDENFVFLDPILPGDLTLKLRQDSKGARTVVFPDRIRWANSEVPVLSTGSRSIDILKLYFDGENYYGTSIYYNFKSIPEDTYLYSEGTENVAWISGYKRNYSYAEKKSGWLYAQIGRKDSSDYTYVTDLPIDLTDVDEIIVDWDTNGYDPYSVRLTAGSDKMGRARLDPYKVGRGDEFSRTETILNVSDVNGLNYVKVALEGSYSTPSNSEFRVYNVYMRKYP